MDPVIAEAAPGIGTETAAVLTVPFPAEFEAYTLIFPPTKAVE